MKVRVVLAVLIGTLVLACSTADPVPVEPTPNSVFALAEKQSDTAQVFSGSVGNAPAATPIPTYTPMPTYTPHPTYTPPPMPTFTPHPTYTPWPTPVVGPTYTPYPTSTPSPIPTPAPTPTPTVVPTPRPHGMQLSVNGTPLDPGQTVFGIVNGLLVFDPAPDEFGEYEQDTSITVTAFPTVAGSMVILSGVNKLSFKANTGTVLARDREWSMTAFITLPPSAPTPVLTATAVPTPTPTPTGPMLTPTPTQQYTQGVTGSSTASATATPTPGQTPTPTQQYTQGVTGN